MLTNTADISSVLSEREFLYGLINFLNLVKGFAVPEQKRELLPILTFRYLNDGIVSFINDRFVAVHRHRCGKQDHNLQRYVRGLREPFLQRGIRRSVSQCLEQKCTLGDPANNFIAQIRDTLLLLNCSINLDGQHGVEPLLFLRVHLSASSTIIVDENLHSTTPLSMRTNA